MQYLARARARPSAVCARTRIGWLVVLAALGVLAAGPSQAQLFGDDEARRAIIELRERVEVNRRQAEARLDRLTQEWTKLNEDAGASSRRGLLDLSNQIEALRQELARQQGQHEQLARAVADLQRQQKDALVAFDDRLRQLEPFKVQHDGQEFAVRPDERLAFEMALESVRKGQFAQAVSGFSGFLQRHPQSGYAPSAWFWLGNAQYAEGAHREAIDAYRRLLTAHPDHLRVPEARLAIANSQIELKDTKAARKTLDELVRLHPQSEAAVAAKERLTRLR